MFYMLVRFYYLSSSRERYVISVRRGCVTVASALLHMPAHVPSQMPAVLSVIEASGTMVTLCAAISFILSLSPLFAQASLSLFFLFPLAVSLLSFVLFHFSLSLSHSFFLSLQVVVCSSAHSVTTSYVRTTSSSTRPAARSWRQKTSSVSLSAILFESPTIDLLVCDQKQLPCFTFAGASCNRLGQYSCLRCKVCKAEIFFHVVLFPAPSSIVMYWI